MSIFAELQELLAPIIPTENDTFPEKPPDTYAVLTSLDDRLDLYADDYPQVEIQSVRISVFTKHNYLSLVNGIKKLLLASDFTITRTAKIDYERDTKYHHYAIEVEKDYSF